MGVWAVEVELQRAKSFGVSSESERDPADLCVRSEIRFLGIPQRRVRCSVRCVMVLCGGGGGGGTFRLD